MAPPGGETIVLQMTSDEPPWMSVAAGRDRRADTDTDRQRERELRRVVGSLELVDVAPRVVYVFLAYCVHEKARKHHVDNLPHTHTHTHIRVN